MTDTKTTATKAQQAWACLRPDGSVARMYKTYGPLAIFPSEEDARGAAGPQESVREVVVISESQVGGEAASHG